ncbi:MAG: hypothetical protein ACHP7J_00470 [Terriglobales bacterium]
MRNWKIAAGIAFLFSLASPCLADVALIMAEPYGHFGAWNPTGHAAVYMTRVCAETPTRLRRCGPGELGVVISRYEGVAGLDWLAVPVIPYLYAVDRVEDIPDLADRAAVSRLRDTYRRDHLSSLIPDDPARPAPAGSWIQLVGASYDRKLYFFQIETAEAQDDALIADLNQAANHQRFHLFFQNCADFARSVINHYYPKTAHRNFTADFGLTTPKHISRDLVRFSRKHRELRFSAFSVAQVPGSPRSHPARGVMESLVRTKKYAIPLVVFHPLVVGGMASSYLAAGRFNPSTLCETVLTPADVRTGDPHPERGNGILSTLRAERQSASAAGSSFRQPTSAE